MAVTPPLPPGYRLDGPPMPLRDPNLLKPLLDAGVTPTNGYRTPMDIQRLKVAGYKPASNSLHLDGDAVDLTPGKSGLGMTDLQARAQTIAKGWPGGRAIPEGDHVHLQLPGWGQAPGTPGAPNSGLPPLPQGFKLQQRGSLSGGNYAPTGDVHDGDTLSLSGGGSGRLSGVDAWELGQKGRRMSGALEPIGVEARDALAARVSGSTPVTATGAETYGRPVVKLGGEGNDPAVDLLRNGNVLAAPEYLKGDPRFPTYMEAERLARQNRLGGHGTNAETPSHYRHKDGPWQGAEPGQYGNGSAVFGDEPTPFQGLRPEVEQAYLAIANDPKSTGADFVAFGKANGFEPDPADIDRFLTARTKGAPTDQRVRYKDAPRILTDPGDGKFGTTARGFGDPFNMIDELGGVVDTLGGSGGRENIWNSERRFGDVLWNNIDQNRSILAHDEATHPYYRMGGQLAGGLVVPVAGEARTIGQLAKIGAVEGGLAGFGAGEGDIQQRLPNAAVGAGLGAAGGVALGAAGTGIAKGYRMVRGRMLPAAEGSAAEQAARETSVPSPPPGYVMDSASPRSAAMMMDDHAATVSGPRARDVIDIARTTAVPRLPPPPPGYVLDTPFGATRKATDPLNASDIANLGQGVEPSSVLPRPASQVDTMEEAALANPGPFKLVDSPDEFSELAVRRIGRGTRVRGPLDMTQSVRMLGGIKDDGGDFAHLGIDNAPRRMDFGSNEQFLGKLTHPNGMHPDDAAFALWEEGYFPEFQEAPTGADLLDRLHQESTGANRFFHPDDLEEVSRFEGAQAQRGAVERAQDEGSPLVEERGSLITLDDLEANRPPASAYEDMPRIVGKLGNINLDRLEKPADVAQLIDQVQKRVGGFDPASRGRVTNEQTRLLADELGLAPETLIKRQTGQALNAEQLYATRALVQKSREVVGNLAKKAVGGSDEEVLSFRKAWVRHVALEEQVTGATAEAGRALQQFNMIAKGGDARGAAVKAYLKGAGGRESIEDAAQAIVDLMEDPAKANHFMREGLKPTWKDKFNELWINSLLSGPKTHVVNFVGNAVNTIYSLPEQALTAGIGKALGSADRSYIGEVGARVSGLANASVEGLQRAKKAFITGDAADDVMKVDSRVQEAIGGRLGKVVRLPTRALTAADEFWKSINANAELHALAYRKAMQEGTSAADRRTRYENLLKAPTGDMAAAAEDAARYYTFQRELGVAGKAVQQLSNKVPFLKVVIPFVRTPANILKFAGERSVFGVAMPEVRAALKAGGRSRDEALARITMGSGLSTAAVLAAMNGRLSGSGPSDPRERASLLQAGWQPYSVKVGDRWVSYQRFDPLSMLAGVAADFVDAAGNMKRAEAGALAMHLSLGIAKNLTNKTWLSGAADFFQMLDDPDRYGEGYFRRLAATAVVPSAANQVAQAIDPNMRDARTLMDAIKARTPGLSQSVAPRRDMWGEAITRGDSLGPDIVSPLYSTKQSSDPLRAEVARLRVPVSSAQRSIMVDGEKVALDPGQYDEYQRLGGAAAQAALRQAMGSAEWRTMTDAERSEFVREAFKDARKGARGELLTRHPDLSGRVLPRMPSGLSPPTARQKSNMPSLPPGYRLNQ